MLCAGCGVKKIWRHSETHCYECHSRLGYDTSIEVPLKCLDELFGEGQADVVLAYIKAWKRQSQREFERKYEEEPLG